MAKDKTTSYNESDIVAHEGLEVVRIRPGMYVGELGTPAIGTLLKEGIDNSLDEALAGRNDTVQVGHVDGWYIVHDCGVGIPVGPHPKLKISTLEVAFTKLHAGGKFNSKVYSASRGTHGVGVKCITALCDELHVYTFRDGHWWTQSYARGKTTSQVEKVTDLSDLKWYADRLPWPQSVKDFGGTLLAWQCDHSILGEGKLDERWLDEYLATIALLNPGLYTAYKNGKGVTTEYHNEEGPTGFIKFYANVLKYGLEQEPLVIQREKSFKKMEKRPDDKGVLADLEVDANFKIDVAIQLTDSPDAKVWGYTNCGYNQNGGTHVSAFWDSFYYELKKVAGKDAHFSERDIQHSMLGYINWGMSEPMFSSQTKERLVSKVADEVWELVNKDLAKFLADNTDFADTVIARATALASARGNIAGINALAAALKTKGKREDDLPETLQQATGKPIELYVCEGDSAAGHCVIGSTPILLADGTTKTIEQLEADASIRGVIHRGRGFNLKTMRPEDVLLAHPRITKYVQETVALTVDGVDFEFTPDHRVLLETGRYRPAGEVQLGDRLLGIKRPQAVTGVAVKRRGSPIPVYDVTTTTENFALGNGLIVHNSKYARIAEHQEVLALRGKVLNVVQKGFSSALDSKPILSILKAIQYDPKKAAVGQMTLRHERIFIAADADPDGAHITLLVLGALWTLVPDLINDGKVFIVDSPLYLALHGDKEYTGQTLAELLAQLPANFKRENIVRAKGLGELTPQWLKYTVFDPATRKIRKVLPPTTTEEEAWFNAIVGENSNARKILLGIIEADSSTAKEEDQ